MGCGSSKSGGDFVHPDDAAADENNNPEYKASYDPARDDPEGLPLSSLIPCPVLAAMYNAGNFSTLADQVVAAQSEEFKGWDASPAHEALYQSRIPSDEVKRVLESVNVATHVADAVVAATETDPRIFQLQNAKHKHGDATRIRYDYVTRLAGFSSERFKSFWERLDLDLDRGISKDEMKQMLHSLENTDRNGRLDWLKKYNVFVLVFHACASLTTSLLLRRMYWELCASSDSASSHASCIMLRGRGRHARGESQRVAKPVSREMAGGHNGAAN